MPNSLYKKILFVLNEKGIFTFTSLTILIALLSTISPYLLGVFVNSLIDKKSVIYTFLLLFFCSFLGVFLKKIHDLLVAKISKNKHIKLQGIYLKKISSFSPNDLETFKNGELGIKFFRDVQNLSEILSRFYPLVLEFICATIFAFAFVFYCNWIVGVAFVLLIPISLFFIQPYSKVFTKINSIFRNATDSVYCKVFENFFSLPFLKSVASENFYLRDVQTKFASLAKISCKNNIYEANFNFSINLLLASGDFLVLAISAFLAYKGKITIGDIIFFHILFTTTFNSFSNIYKLLPNFALIKESFNSLDELDNLKTENFVEDKFDFKGNIELKNVSFAYKSNNRSILQNFSLKISKGDFVSIEGINGAGKTTLLKILSAYLQPDSGKVFFDGIEIKNVNLNNLRKNISIVNQEFLLISESIKNNITLHNKQYSEEEIYQIINLVGLRKLIDSLPNGINEIVGNNGKKLSGGETQKIAIARALIKKPSLIVFDEITNHLDKNSKEQILKIVASLKGKITVLFVSHDSLENIAINKVINLGSKIQI